MWIFDTSDGEGRLLRFRSGHSAPPTCIRSAFCLCQYHRRNGFASLMVTECFPDRCNIRAQLIQHSCTCTAALICKHGFLVFLKTGKASECFRCVRCRDGYQNSMFSRFKLWFQTLKEKKKVFEIILKQKSVLSTSKARNMFASC